MTNSISETADSKVLFIIGSNTRENHPVIGAKIKTAKLKGAKVIVADPRRIELAEDADVFLHIKLGTNIALINGMMNVIISEGLYDKEYVEKNTEDFEGMKKLIEKYTPEFAGEICGVSPDLIREAGRIFASDVASIYYAMGITQHKTGTNGVMSLSNLSLLCGNIGKKFGGINPLRGQNNVQGSCDMGGLPGDFPGYQKVYDDKVREKFEKEWKVKLEKRVGYKLPEMMHRAGHGDLKCLYIMGENPMVSDPDIAHIQHSLESVDLLIVQDIFMTETAELADVVLPALSFAEQEGTFTNTERRVQRVRKVVTREGLKCDWEIINDLMNRMGYEHVYKSAQEIMEEIARVTPQYAGITYELIDKLGVPWPINKGEKVGTAILHVGHPMRGKGKFVPCENEMTGEQVSPKYPYLLTNGRNLYHYHTRSMTGRVEGLNMKSPDSYIEINPLTMEKLHISKDEMVQVSSKRGSIITRAVPNDGILEDLFFMPFHFAEGACNILTGAEHLDENCGIPELKVTAVNIRKLD